MRPRLRRGFDPKRFPGVRPVAWLCLAYLYVPISILILLSFNANRTATIWTEFSTQWYGVALGNEEALKAAGNSLTIALVAMIGSTIAATLAALPMARSRFRGQNGLNGVLALPLVVPEIVTAVATLIFFVLIGVKLGLLSVMIAHTVFCIPFAYLPIRARLQDMDPRMEEAAADLYANEWQAFRRVTLPLMWPGVLSGASLAFIISLDNFVITFFVSGPGSTTLPIYIYGLIRVGVTPEVNALSSAMILVSVIFVSLSFLFGRQKA